MLAATHRLYGTSVEATDRIAGTVRDLLFDDQSWDVRFFVVHSGNWLTGQSELLSPEVIDRTNWMGHRLVVQLTEQQVRESSADVEAHLPASAQKRHERETLIAWEAYWSGALASPVDGEVDPHLDSVKEVTGYHVEATDGPIGHVEDFIVDDENWMIRYLVVDSRNWLPGRHALIGSLSVDSVDWNARKIHANLSREKILHAPEYDRTVPVYREYEELLSDYYGLPEYWAGQTVSGATAV